MEQENNQQPAEEIVKVITFDRNNSSIRKEIEKIGIEIGEDFLIGVSTTVVIKKNPFSAKANFTRSFYNQMEQEHHNVTAHCGMNGPMFLSVVNSEYNKAKRENT